MNFKLKKNCHDVQGVQNINETYFIYNIQYTVLARTIIVESTIHIFNV